MAGMSAMALVGGLAFSAVGTGMQFMGMQKSAKAQKAQFGLSMNTELQRKEAMDLDAKRRTRESMRQAYTARGEALNASANSGSQLGSGLQGQLDNITNQEQSNVSAIQQQKDIGETISSDTMESGRQGVLASEGQSLAAMGAGISSLGGAFTKSLDSFGRIGSQIGV